MEICKKAKVGKTLVYDVRKMVKDGVSLEPEPIGRPKRIDGGKAMQEKFGWAAGTETVRTYLKRIMPRIRQHKVCPLNKKPKSYGMSLPRNNKTQKAIRNSWPRMRLTSGSMIRMRYR